MNPSDSGFPYNRDLSIDQRVSIWAEGFDVSDICLDPSPISSDDVPLACALMIERMEYDSGLIVCQSRVDCCEMLNALDEQATEFGPSTENQEGEDPVYAAIYPSRVAYGAEDGTGNCMNYDEAKQSEAEGLPPHDAVCRSCSFNKDCKYLETLKQARGARFGIMNAARAKYSGFSEDEGRKDILIFTNSRPLDVLKPRYNVRSCSQQYSLFHRAPPLTTEEAREQLACLATAVSRSKVEAKLGADDDFLPFYEVLLNFICSLTETIDTGVNCDVGLPNPIDPPEKWSKYIHRELRAAKSKPNAELVRICTSAAAGKLESLVIRVSSSGRVRFFGTEIPRDPETHTIILDGTFDSDEISAAIGRDVYSLPTTPPAVYAVQVPVRVTAKKRPGQISKIIRAHLTARPGKLGVILPRRIRPDDVESRLSAEDLARLTIITFNDLTTIVMSCDHILVMGTPPVNPDAVVDRMCQTGRGADATGDPQWGDLPWVGRLGDGQTVTVRRKGYRNQAFQAHYQDLVAGWTIQFIVDLPGFDVPGRITLYSAEKLGLPLVRPPTPLDNDHLTILNAVRELTAENATRYSISDNIGDPRGTGICSCASKSLVANLADNASALPSRPRTVSSKDVAQLIGIPERTVRAKLGQLEKDGLVKRFGKRGGWYA